MTAKRALAVPTKSYKLDGTLDSERVSLARCSNCGQFVWGDPNHSYSYIYSYFYCYSYCHSHSYRQAGRWTGDPCWSDTWTKPLLSEAGPDRWMNMSSVTARCKLIRPYKDTTFLMDGQVKHSVLVLFPLAFIPTTISIRPCNPFAFLMQKTWIRPAL